MTLVNVETGEIIATLADLEVVIERGLGTFVKVGEALATIRDQRLYRQGHETFEDYCRDRWGFSASRARQLIGASETVTAVTVGGGPAPTNEAQARALTAVKDAPSDAAEAMQRASDNTGGNPTAEAIADAVTEIIAEKEAEKASKAEDAAAREEIADLADKAGFDMDEKRRQRLGRFSTLCRDLSKFDLDGFVAEQRPFIKERHVTYAENAYAALDEFLLTVREESK